MVQQDLSLLEFATGWDVINKYNIWDADSGESLFFAKEGNIGCCARNCFQGERDFEMPLVTEGTVEPTVVFDDLKCFAKLELFLEIMNFKVNPCG